MTNLLSDLNAVDKSGFADANKVSFEAGDDGAINVRFDQQGTNTTTVSTVSYDADGTSAAAVSREIMFNGADLAPAFAASDATGDAFTVTVNDGTSAMTFTFTATSAGNAVTNVADLATALNAGLGGATVVTANSAAALDVTFSADNGQLKVTFDTAGATQNDFL